MKKYVAVALFSALLLGACSEEEVVKEPIASPTKEVVVEKEPEPKPTIGSVSLYSEQMSGSLEGLSNVSNDLTNQTIKVSENPAIVTDEGWIADTEDILESLEIAVSNVRAINPPEDAMLREAYDLTMLAMDENDFIVENYLVGMMTMDLELIQEFTAAFERSTEYMRASNEIVLEYMEK